MASLSLLTYDVVSPSLETPPPPAVILSSNISTDKIQYFSMNSEDTVQNPVEFRLVNNSVTSYALLFPIFRQYWSCLSAHVPHPTFPPLAFDIYALRCVFFLYWNAILKHIIHTGLWFSKDGKSTAKRRNLLKIGSSQGCIHNTQHTGKTNPHPK